MWRGMNLDLIGFIVDGDGELEDIPVWLDNLTVWS